MVITIFLFLSVLTFSLFARVLPSVISPPRGGKRWAWLFLLLGLWGQDALALNSGDVTVTMTSSSLLVVDSNKCPAPNNEGPHAAYVSFRVTNTLGTTLTNLSATLGGFDTANGFNFAGGQAATQYIGTLAPGASTVLFWFMQYPCTLNLNDTITVTVSDSNPGTVSGNGTVTTRSHISANAGGLITSAALGPGAIVGQIIDYAVNYNFGNGNIGDIVNLQPAGNIAFNAGCFQLVGTEITASTYNGVPAGTIDQILFVPTVVDSGTANNVTVRYRFLYICAGVSTLASPYASQTSGTQDKYTPNFGATEFTPQFPSATNPFTISKSVSPLTLPVGGGTVTYTVTISNPSSYSAIMDRITDVLPAGVTYQGIVAGSDITNANSSSAPSAGATGTIVWHGIPETSYFIATNGSISLRYTATVTANGTYTNSATVSVGTATNGPATATFIVAPARIKGTVWLDGDGDGINDVGEPGITGVTVNIYSAGPNGVIGGGDDVLVGTVTTDANGNYSRDDLPIGMYYVDVTDTGGQLTGLTTAPGTTDPSALLTIPAGGTGTANFGYVPTGSTNGVEGMVWGDADGDGIQDASEAGIGGATIQLVRAGTDGVFGTPDDVVAATTTTDPDGGYLFTGVTAGEYVVRVVNNATLTGYTPTSGPDSEGGYVSSPVTVAAGDVAAGIDFGFDRATLYAVSDRIWNDADGDGVFDANEDGIGGVLVNLRDNSGNIVATVMTNADGTFSFTGVPNGNYTLAVINNAGILVGMTGTTAIATALSRAVTVSGADIPGTNFGYRALGLVGSLIWSDADGDGVRDAGEVGLGGVPVELRDGVCIPGSTCRTTVTAADGSYRFTGVAAGSYTVVVTTPPTGTQTGDPDQPGVACTTCNNQGTATVPASGGDPDLDFGYRNTTLADVSGTVFNDIDGDGIQEAGEGGLAGVTVELRNAAGVAVATVTTDASGNYAFSDVPAGNYTVVVTDQDALLSGYTASSGLDQRAITVPATGTVDVDFGYGQKTTTAQFSSTVWLDENNNGLQGSGEVGLSGVTVNLYRDSNLDGIPDGAAVATTTTDVNGNYVFRNLAPGTYLVDSVEGTLPGALTPTTYISPIYAQVSLSEGEVRSDVADFGYTPAAGTAVLSGVVWSDADSDGFLDVGEGRLGGVTITILNTATNAVVATVNTDPDGSWAVVGLAAGSYAVVYDQTDIPAGYNATQPTNMGSGYTTYTVTVAGGDVVPNLDFGFGDNPGVVGFPYGTVSGTFYHDANANSSQGGGEEGLAGVTMNLVDGTGQIVATTTTDLTGNYSFTGVPPGTYTLVPTDMNAALVGLNPTQLLPASVTVTAGGAVDADAGYSSGQATLTTVGGTVWVDSSNNGILNSGEIGILGVNLELWLDTNNNGIIEPGTDNLVRTATTDAIGAYTFSNVPAGAYLVRVFDAALLSGGYTKTTGPTPGADNNSQANPYPVTVGASSNFTADFGYFTATYTISGTVFEDISNNGVNNSEPAVEGAVVSIYRVVNGTRQLVATVTTGLTGTYTSPALPPGSYEVEVNTQGTAVAGYDQTTQTGTGGVTTITLSGNVTGTDFGFYNDAALTTTPITLASFQALPGATAGTLEVKWTTATEAGNVGFFVHGRMYGGEWQKLTPRLIPSKTVDSLEPQTYTVTLSNVAWVQEVALEDVSIRGKKTLHGPFPIGTVVGVPPTVERIKWPAIRQAKDLELKRSKRRVLRGKPATGLMRAARISVRTPGIQRVTHEQLLAAGIDLSKVPVAQIAVTDNGQPVPRAIGGRPIFGPGSYLEFIGQVTPTLYSKENVYLLTVDPTKSRKVKDLTAGAGPAAVVGHEATYTAYPNREYSFSAPTGDPWYDAYVLAYGGPASLRRDFTLSAVVPGAARMKVALWGYIDWPTTGADHHVMVKLNGQVVYDGRFDGVTAHPVEVALAPGVLRDGLNSLEVVLPWDTGLEYDMVALEGFEVRYQRQSVAEAGAWTGKVTAVSGPFTVSGLSAGPAIVWQGINERLGTTVAAGQVIVPGGVAGTYWLASSSGINTPAIEAGIPEVAVNTQVDYLIITHPAFLDTIAPIEALQATRKLTTAVMTTESLYARYTDHAVDAKAISSYIAQTRPQFVLLVGGDVVDYHDNLKTGSVSFVPTRYVRTDAIVAYSPSDVKHADWTGDNLPDAAIGRLPVRTVAELQAVTAKLQMHEQRQSEFTAVLATGKSDRRSIFTQEHRAIGGQLGPQWQISEAAMDLVGKTAARQLLFDAINGGVEVTSYYGHSSYGLLDFDRLFTWQDVALLTNRGRPTVMTMWGCWNSYFVSAGIETLANRLLLTPEVGAVAVFGSATLTKLSSHKALGSQLFSRFGGAETLGEAIMAAQRQVGKTNPAALDAILGMNLLGDPAMPLFR